MKKSDVLWQRYQAQPVDVQRRMAFSILPALWGAMQAVGDMHEDIKHPWSGIETTIESIERSERHRQQQKETTHG